MTTILEEAGQAVEARQPEYGEPEANHGRTAQLWNAYLTARYGARLYAISAEDVCWLNVLQKIARDCEAPGRDNLVDVAGYVRNIELIRG